MKKYLVLSGIEPESRGIAPYTKVESTNCTTHPHWNGVHFQDSQIDSFKDESDGRTKIEYSTLSNISCHQYHLSCMSEV